MMGVTTWERESVMIKCVLKQRSNQECGVMCSLTGMSVTCTWDVHVARWLLAAATAHKSAGCDHVCHTKQSMSPDWQSHTTQCLITNKYHSPDHTHSLGWYLPQATVCLLPKHYNYSLLPLLLKVDDDTLADSLKQRYCCLQTKRWYGYISAKFPNYELI